MLTVIGNVVKLREKLNWFENRPLFGRRIAVTRAREQAGSFVQRLAELGADVLKVPTIKITGRPTGSLVDALLELNAYDWLVFTSANGVTAFFDLFFSGSGICATSAARASPPSARRPLRIARAAFTGGFDT